MRSLVYLTGCVFKMAELKEKGSLTIQHLRSLTNYKNLINLFAIIYEKCI
jgi:hypothetical protein